MIFTVLYYLASTALISSSVFGIYYFVDPMAAGNLVTQASWYSMRTYVQINEYFNEAEKDSDDENNADTVSDADEGDLGDKYIHYTMEPEESLHTCYIDEYTRKDIKKRHTTDLEMVLTKINNNEYYKIIDENTQVKNLSFLPIEKQFIQVELEQNNNKKCIHTYLDKFYLTDNKLFTKAWLKWYLSKFFNETLEDDYSIHLIDKDVNLFKITNKEYILLTSQNYETHQIE